MDKNELTDLDLDYETGLRRFMGNEQVFDSFLLRFVEDPNTAELKKALEKHDFKEAFERAHTIKGVVGSLSLNGLYAKICLVVEDLRGDVKESVSDDFKSYYQHYQLVIRALQK